MTPMPAEQESADSSSSTQQKQCILQSCCRCWGFNVTTLFLLQSSFVVLTILTAVGLTLSNYNRVPATDWILVGGLTSTGATFRIRVVDGGATFFVISTDEDLDDTVYEVELDVPTSSSSGGGGATVQSVTVMDLPVTGPSKYHYATYGPTGNILRRGTFRTTADVGSPMNFTVATMACSMTGSKHPVFAAAASHDPLLVLHGGDLHYLDVNSDDVSDRIHALDRTFGSTVMSELFNSAGLAYMWDDHDWLGNNALGYGAKGRDAALESYRVGFPFHSPLPAASVAATGGGGNITASSAAAATTTTTSAQHEESYPPYHAFTVGTVRFVLTDLRSERTSTSIFSAAQKEWFFSELDDASSYDFVVWMSTVPWIGPANSRGEGDDSWMAYPDNRTEVSDYIDATVGGGGGGGGGGRRNLIVVSGDAHMVAFDDGRNTYYGTNTNNRTTPLGSFPILQTGPLDRPGSVKGGPFSDGCHCVRYERNHHYSTIRFEIPPSPVSERQQQGQEGAELPCLVIESYRVGNKASEKEIILRKRLCGEVFFRPSPNNSSGGGVSTATVDRGSCDAPPFSTGSTALLSLSAVLCGLAVAGSCYFLGIGLWGESARVSLTVAILYVLTLAAGGGIPFAMGYKQFDTLVVLVLATLEMVAVCVFLGFWVRRRARGARGKGKGDEEEDVGGGEVVQADSMLSERGKWEQLPLGIASMDSSRQL